MIPYYDGYQLEGGGGQPQQVGEGGQQQQQQQQQGQHQQQQQPGAMPPPAPPILTPTRDVEAFNRCVRMHHIQHEPYPPPHPPKSRTHNRVLCTTVV